MIDKNQQNNEEWVKEFDKLWLKMYVAGWVEMLGGESKQMKEFIRQQRQEAYNEGFLHGTDLQVHLNKASNFPAVSKQAVREFTEYILDWMLKNDLDPDGGYYKIDCYDLEKALEVYEVKNENK